MLLMVMGILGRGTTKKQPEASPASSVIYRCMRISVWSCVSDGGRCGRSGDSSLCLRRLGLTCTIGVLCGVAIGRACGACGACGRVPGFQWNNFHPSFSCTCVPTFALGIRNIDDCCVTRAELDIFTTLSCRESISNPVERAGSG